MNNCIAISYFGPKIGHVEQKTIFLDFIELIIFSVSTYFSAGLFGCEFNDICLVITFINDIVTLIGAENLSNNLLYIYLKAFSWIIIAAALMTDDIKIMARVGFDH